MSAETFGILTDKGLSIFEDKDGMLVSVSSIPLSTDYAIKDIIFDKKNKKFFILTENCQILRSGIYGSMFSLASNTFEVLVEVGCISMMLSDKNTLVIMDNQGLWQLDELSGNWHFIYKVINLKKMLIDVVVVLYIALLNLKVWSLFWLFVLFLILGPFLNE